MSRRPLYWRLLRLRHVRPNGWQRALLGEGSVVLAVVLVLADLATAWTLLVLPVAVAAVVKVHDVVAGLLAPPRAHPAVAAPASAEPEVGVVAGASATGASATGAVRPEPAGGAGRGNGNGAAPCREDGAIGA